MWHSGSPFRARLEWLAHSPFRPIKNLGTLVAFQTPLGISPVWSEKSTQCIVLSKFEEEQEENEKEEIVRRRRCRLGSLLASWEILQGLRGRYTLCYGWRSFSFHLLPCHLGLQRRFSAFNFQSRSRFMPVHTERSTVHSPQYLCPGTTSQPDSLEIWFGSDTQIKCVKSRIRVGLPNTASLLFRRTFERPCGRLGQM